MLTIGIRLIYRVSIYRQFYFIFDELRERPILGIGFRHIFTILKRLSIFLFIPAIKNLQIHFRIKFIVRGVLGKFLATTMLLHQPFEVCTKNSHIVH